MLESEGHGCGLRCECLIVHNTYAYVRADSTRVARLFRPIAKLGYVPSGASSPTQAIFKDRGRLAGRRPGGQQTSLGGPHAVWWPRHDTGCTNMPTAALPPTRPHPSPRRLGMDLRCLNRAQTAGRRAEQRKVEHGHHARTVAQVRNPLSGRDHRTSGTRCEGDGEQRCAHARGSVTPTCPWYLPPRSL